MADYGINVWDKVGALGYQSSQRVGQIMYSGIIPALGSVVVPDVDGVPKMYGEWTIHGEFLGYDSTSFITFSYNPGTRDLTISNTSGTMWPSTGNVAVFIIW